MACVSALSDKTEAENINNNIRDKRTFVNKIKTNQKCANGNSEKDRRMNNNSLEVQDQTKKKQGKVLHVGLILFFVVIFFSKSTKKTKVVV